MKTLRNHRTSILVYRIGQLGDAVVALPAIHTLRDVFPGAQMTLLCDYHPGKKFVFAADLFKGSGFFDAVKPYAVDRSFRGRLLRPLRMLHLLGQLRAARFDIVAYLAPSSRTDRQIRRDRQFFRAAGIPKLLGMEARERGRKTAQELALNEVEHEADFLLSQLAVSGLPVPSKGHGCIDLALTPADDRQVDEWLSRLPLPHASSWIGFGPGSKMPAKKWPPERFEEVGHELIKKFNLWPVIFGGSEDKESGDHLLRAWKRGFNAAGELGIRASAAALRRCVLYVGNDTGTMHLAAAAGTPCVAVFSSRDLPGKWNPYGFRHHVLRAQIDCEGCMLMTCHQRDNECLKRISVADVLSACQQVLSRSEQSIPSYTSNAHDGSGIDTLSASRVSRYEASAGPHVQAVTECQEVLTSSPQFL